jgi:D-sedoheptulose 7-phosphate isomerase
MTLAPPYARHLVAAIGAIDWRNVQIAIQWFHKALVSERTIFVAGNGGSAATASHFACDMAKTASYGRSKRFRVIALNDNMPTLTAYSNDVGYDAVFVETLKNFARSEDIFMAISGSGNSPNVVRAMEYANAAGCRTIALTGRDGGRLGPLSQLNIHIPVQHMGCIEDADMMLCHMITYHFLENPSFATYRQKSSAPNELLENLKDLGNRQAI